MSKTTTKVPVSIGDVIFVVPSKVNYELNIINKHEECNRTYEQKISSIQWWSNDRYLIQTCDGLNQVLNDTQGEIWFTDKVNAEWKLERLKENAQYLYC